MKYFNFTQGEWVDTGQIMMLRDTRMIVWGFLAPIRNQILEQDIQSLIQAHRRLEDEQSNIHKNR